MSVLQLLARRIHLSWETGRKQAQDPPGSLHTHVSSVGWSSLKGRGPRWYTVRKTTCSTQTPHMCVTQPLGGWIQSKWNSGREQAQDSPGILHTTFSSREGSFLGYWGRRGVMFIHCLKKKKRRKTPDTCVAGSLMCCYKLIHMSAKQSELGSKWPSKFRGPKQERCRNCMKPCSVRSLFHYV